MRKPKKKDRRTFIYQRAVLDDQRLPLREIRDAVGEPGYTYEAAKRDKEFFESFGCLLELQDCLNDPDDKEFISLQGPHTDDDRIRESTNVEPKELVARLAASLICGLSEIPEENLIPNWLREPLAHQALDNMRVHGDHKNAIQETIVNVLSHLQSKMRSQQDPQALDSQQGVLKLLEHSNLALDKNMKALRTKLFSFWGEPYRMVAIDAGTTNSKLAQYLRELRLPISGSSLCSLTVCTNSRRIFEILGPAEVSVKTIIIGGQQKFHSPAIAGTMAELFLRTASILQFGMCILGATKVDLEKFFVGSDSQEEATIKNMLMERSSLRVVCVDSSKLRAGPGRTAYKYALIDPQHIDLILTNSLFREGNTEEDFEIFKSGVRSIEQRGLPVLVATSTKTYPHPNAEDSTATTPKKRTRMVRVASNGPT